MESRAIYQAYLAYFGRPPDPTGLSAFAAASQTDVIAAFSASAESRALYAGTSLLEQINAIYLNLFGRVAEPAGAEYWLNELSAGRFTLAEMAFAVLNGARNSDATTVANKLQVMEEFVVQLAARADGGAAYSGNAAAASARGFLSHINADSASLAEALAGVGTAVETAVALNDAAKDGPETSLSASDGRVFPLVFEVSSFISSTTTRNAGLDAFLADGRFTGINGAGQTVVVIDSSFDLDHPAFGVDADGNGAADRILFSADFSLERNGANTRLTAVDKHGTHVASLVGSELADAPGMAPGANLILLQVLTEVGIGTTNDVEQALRWVMLNAALYNVVAVNLSLGGADNDASATLGAMSDELAALVQLGVIPVVAAGNDYREFQRQGVSEPASDPNALAVSASGSSNSALAPFSQRSETLTDIVAPGQGVRGASAGGGTIALDGTSMAAPITSGAVALAQQLAQQTLGRRLSVEEVYRVLQGGASVFTDSEVASDGVRNSGASFRHINIDGMAEAVLALSATPPTPTPTPAPAPRSLLALAVPPAPSDDFGDTAQTAGSLAAGQSRQGVLERAGDRDWFAVDLVAGRRYEVTLDGSTLNDPYLRIFDAAGRLLAENDDRDTGGLDSAIGFLAATSGRHFVVADSYLSRGTGAYQIAISAGSAPGGNESGTVGSGDQDLRGDISYGGERDSLNLTLTAGVPYTFSMRGTSSGSGTLRDPFLELLRGNAVQASDDDGGTGLDAELRFTPTVSGAYTLRASAYSEGDRGSYALQIRGSAGSGGTGDTVAGSTASTASVAVGGRVAGRIDFGSDEDWYRIALDAGRSYSFGLTGLADGLLSLYDSQGRFLRSDDDSGNGLDPLLSYTPTSGGNYFLAAAAFADRETGDFTLTANVSGGGSGVSSGTRIIGPAQLNVPISGVLPDQNSFDVYTGTLTPGSYRVTVRPAGGSDPLRDPFVYVDSDLDFRDGFYDDDGGTGLDSLLLFSIDTTTSGVIAVGGFDAGAYTLLIQPT